MSIFWCRLKYFLQTLLALAVSVLLVLGIWTAQISRFSAIDGERVFYLRSASSQGLRRETLSLCDFPNIRGESVRFMLSGDTDREEYAVGIAQRHQASILFIEETAGVTSYYGYTAKWADGVVINGKKINLHIAISTDENKGERLCVVGSPIIFDGY